MTVNREKLKKIILEEIKKLNKKSLLTESGFQPQSSLKKFQQQRGGMMSALMGGGSNKPSTPMEQDFGWNPPDVDSYDGKYQLTMSENFQNGKSIITEDKEDIESSAEAQIVMNTSDVKKCTGAKSNKDLWKIVEGKGWYFGKYPLNEREDEDVRSWRKIINELAENGPRLPIEIHVWYNGEAKLHESKYGVAAYDLLGIPQIPAHIKWYGGSGGTENDQLKEYYQRAFLPKNADSLGQYFDHVDGMNFMSDRKRTDWVDDEWDGPVSPKDAFETGNYQTGKF